MSEYLLEIHNMDFSKAKQKEKMHFMTLYNNSKSKLCYYYNKKNHESKIDLITFMSKIDNPREKLALQYVIMHEKDLSLIVAIAIYKKYENSNELQLLCTVNMPKEMNNRKLTKILLDSIDKISKTNNKTFRCYEKLHNDISSWKLSKSRTNSRKGERKDSYQRAYDDFEKELESQYREQRKRNLSSRNRRVFNVTTKKRPVVKDSLKHLVGRTFTNKSRKNIRKRNYFSY